MIQRFNAHLQWCYRDQGVWFSSIRDCVLEMNPRGHLELIEFVDHIPCWKPPTSIVTTDKGKPNRLVFNRDGDCISKTPSIKALMAGASSRFPKVIGMKNIDPAFPDKYPNKQK